MDKVIKLSVLSSKGVVLEEQATSIVAPGEVGYLGMLHNHAPLATTLSPGELKWKDLEGKERNIEISEGVLEITKNKVTILAEVIERNIEG